MSKKVKVLKNSLIFITFLFLISVFLTLIDFNMRLSKNYSLDFDYYYAAPYLFTLFILTLINIILYIKTKNGYNMKQLGLAFLDFFKHSKNIGKVQLAIGVIILLSSAVYLPTVFSNTYHESYPSLMEWMGDSWESEYNMTNGSVSNHGTRVSGWINFISIYNTSIHTFILLSIIIFILSFILILQGFANMHR